jgi:hypothetical protein
MYDARLKHNNHNVNWLNVLCLVLSIIPWGLVLLSSPRGFDISDEGFYLMSIAYPQEVIASFSMFGVVLHPLYTIAGGNVPLFRALCALIWLGLSAGVAWLSVSLLGTKQPKNDPTGFVIQTKFFITLLLTSAGALYYYLWILTPSYNWLALFGVTLFWGGFLLWLKSESRKWAAHIGALLFAFAAVIVFWAKPPSAAFLLLYPLVALVLNYSQWRRLLNPITLLFGILGFALGMSLPMVYGLSPQTIVTTFIQGIEYQNLMRPDQYSSLVGTVWQSLEQTLALFIASLYPISSIALWLAPLFLAGLLARLLPHTIYRVSAIRLIFAVGLIGNLFVSTASMFDEIGRWSLNVVLLVTLYFVAANNIQRTLTRSVPAQRKQPAYKWMLPIYALVFVYVFGTSNSYAMQSGMAAYLYLLGIAVLLLRIEENTLSAFLLRILVPTLLCAITVLVYVSSLTPYRQDQPIWLMDEVISITDDRSSLTVGEVTAQYSVELQAIAWESGLQAETSLIDLTGTSPGIAYILGAKAYGFPWLLGGYPGSATATTYILRQFDPTHLERAWILTGDQDNYLHIPVSVLTDVGLDFPTRYENVGAVNVSGQGETLTLWRPLLDR